MTPHILDDGSLRVTFQSDHQTISVRILDLRTGVTWGPCVPFVLEAYSLMLQGVEPVNSPTTTIISDANFVEITAHVENPYVAVGATVRFSLEEGELVVRIPTAGIREPRAAVSLLSGIDLLPGLMHVDPERPGHLVLSQRQGVLCFPERHPRSRDRFLMYGEQPRWELLPLLPFAGVVRNACVTGNHPATALLAVVETGDCDAECRVDLDGKGSGETGFALRYRYTPIDTVDPIDREVRFVPLRGTDANYTGMGRRMHRYVMEHSGRGTLEERATANPELDYSSSAFVLKILHACKDIGPLDGTGELRIMTTCDEAMAQLALLKSHGIDKLWVQLTGWNPEGHDGMWPTRFPVEPLIGGDEGFARLIAFGQSLGYQMQVHDNYIDNCINSPEFDPHQCVGSLFGGPLKRGCWGGGLICASWGNAFPESRLKPQMEKVRALGVRGTFYVDDMGFPLELSYNPAHGPHRYRRACAEGINRILIAGREVYGSCGTENGYFYCVPDSDYISSTWMEFPSTPPSELADEPVPIWLMAVKGHLFSNLNDTFSAVPDSPHRTQSTVARRMLMMAEFGLAPRNETVALYTGRWCYPIEETIEAMQFENALMIKTIPSIIRARLVNHEVLEGTPGSATRVVRSTFSDGTQVVCDYARSQLQINGKDYPLPNDFKKRTPIAAGHRSSRFFHEKARLMAETTPVNA